MEILIYHRNRYRETKIQSKIAVNGYSYFNVNLKKIPLREKKMSNKESNLIFPVRHFLFFPLFNYFFQN